MSKKSDIPDTVTITIPFRVAKRGGRKEVRLPPGANNRSPDYTLIKAVARAYRWRQILEDGDLVLRPIEQDPRDRQADPAQPARVFAVQRVLLALQAVAHEDDELLLF